MSTRIVFNDKEYGGVDEMPAEVRRAYEEVVALLADPDRNATDFAPDSSGEHKLNITRLRFLHDGKEYSRFEEMPPEVRRQYEETVRRLGDAERNDIPGMLERGVATGNIGETRHIVVRTTRDVRLESLDVRQSVKSLLSSVGTSFLLAALAALVALVVFFFWRLF